MESDGIQKAPLSSSGADSQSKSANCQEQTLAAQRARDVSTSPTPPSTTSVQTQTSADNSDTGRLGDSTGKLPSSEKGFAKRRFGCDCSDECPSLDYFSNPSVCPRPLPTVSKFPYLDTRGLTEEEREDLEIQLNDDYLNINQEYATFASSLRRSLKERKISPLELADCLMEVKGYESLSNSLEEKGMRLLENRYQEIKGAKDLTRVFEILSDYSSFFNFDIIAFIAKNLGSETDKKNLASYQAALESYCSHHVFECPSCLSSSSKFPDLILKVDPEVTESEKFTLKSLRRFTMKVAKTLKVTKHCLKLCSIKKGCLEITFQIPPHIKEAIVPIIPDQHEALRHLGVQNVSLVALELTCIHTSVFVTHLITSNLMC